MDPRVKKALDERVEWINRVTDLVVDEKLKAVAEAIAEIPDEHLRSMIYVLMLARGGDARTMRELATNWNAAPLN